VAVLFDSVDIERSGRVGLGLIGSKARDNIAAEVGAGGRVGQIQCFAEQRAQEVQQFGLRGRRRPGDSEHCDILDGPQPPFGTKQPCCGTTRWNAADCGTEGASHDARRAKPSI
jgi:hypothetical protein